MDTPHLNPTTKRPSDAQLQDLAARAQARLERLRHEHARHHGKAAPAAADSYTYKGEATFASAFVWTKVKIENTSFSSGPNKTFDGSVWGVGIGGGVSWGGGAFNVPSSELGSCKIHVNIAGVGVEITFFDGDGNPIGTFAGGGVGVGGFEGGGSGSWS